MIPAETIAQLQRLHRKAQVSLWHTEEAITRANVSRTNAGEHLAKAYRDASDAVSKLTELNALISQTLNQ